MSKFSFVSDVIATIEIFRRHGDVDAATGAIDCSSLLIPDSLYQLQDLTAQTHESSFVKATKQETLLPNADTHAVDVSRNSESSINCCNNVV